MKPDPRFSPERVETLRRRSPKGLVVVAPLEPIKGLVVANMTWADLGLKAGEKRAA